MLSVILYYLPCSYTKHTLLQLDRYPIVALLALSAMEQPAARPRRGDERHYNVALVGLGHRGYKTHFQNILGSRSETIVAACDMNATTRSSFSSKHPDVPVFASLQELLAECRPDFAIVCVPHQFHLQCVELLSSVGIPVLKEKPAADSQSQFDQLLHMPVKIGVAFQKRFEPRYVQLEKLLPLVGDVASFRAVLAMNIKDLDATWRANTGVGVTVNSSPNSDVATAYSLNVPYRKILAVTC